MVLYTTFQCDNFLFCRFGQSNQLQNLDDLIEDAYNAFDDIWKLENCNFPESNMINLFDIVGKYLIYGSSLCIMEDMRRNVINYVLFSWSALGAIKPAENITTNVIFPRMPRRLVNNEYLNEFSATVSR